MTCIRLTARDLIIRHSRQQQAAWRKQELEQLIALLDPHQRRLILAAGKAEAEQQLARQQQAAASSLSRRNKPKLCANCWSAVQS